MPLGKNVQMGTVESPGAEGIRRIIDERRAATFPRPRAMVAQFVAFQYLRGPSSRFATVEQYKAIVREDSEDSHSGNVQEVRTRNDGRGSVRR